MKDQKKKQPGRYFKKGPDFKKGLPKGPPPGARPAGPPKAKQLPPESTLREAEYLKSLVTEKTQVRVRLQDDEEVEGVIEYYDTHLIRLTRDGEPNLFIYKREIKYLEEQD